MLPVLLSVENVGARTCGGRSGNLFADVDDLGTIYAY